MNKKDNSISNIDKETVKGFGDEWEKFDQSTLSLKEKKEIFESYFSIFPWHLVNKKSKGFDLGCGSGRWAELVAPKVGELYCIDPSSSIEIAKRNLTHLNNCIFQKESVDTMRIEENSMDFGYSLGVLHHIPDTKEALKKCVSKLKPGAPFLVYLYYALENRPFWFKALWLLSNYLRKFISKLPFSLRYFISQIISALVYFPLARLAFIFQQFKFDTNKFPLSEYRNKSFYTMRTDALDRFGTRLEQRFTSEEIERMMIEAGLEGIDFRDSAPFWCALGYKK